jgi:hypothetical protein
VEKVRAASSGRRRVHKSTQDGAFPMLDCREIPDEATYQKVLEIANTYCPELVQEIEKHKRISDAHQ